MQKFDGGKSMCWRIRFLVVDIARRVSVLTTLTFNLKFCLIAFKQVATAIR